MYESAIAIVLVATWLAIATERMVATTTVVTAERSIVIAKASNSRQSVSRKIVHQQTQ